MLIMPRRGLLAAALSLFGSSRVVRSSPAAAADGAFPADFVWGASTSSYQIEGAVDEDGRGKSIWDVFSHTPGRVKNGDTGDIACDHYHRWRDDIDLLARGNFSAYRFSTAWSRILPSGGGAVEQHGLDEHAPGLKGLPNMLAAIHHLNLAQGRAVQALRAERADLRLGTVISLQPARPSSDNADDRRASERFDAMWNGACLDPLMTGAYPAPIAADFAALAADGDLATMRQPIDYLGVNYYAPMYVMHAPQSLFGAWFGAAPAGTRFTAMGWPIDAGGLSEELIRLRDRYGNPELYVTENGACYDDPLAA